MKDDDLLHKWMDGSISESELMLFKQREEYADLVKIKEDTDNLKVPDWNKQKVLGDILKAKKVQPLPRRNFAIYAIAAAVILLVGLFVFIPRNEVINHVADVGSIDNGELPDKSTFVLNAESKLSFEKRNWSEQRIVLLDGEAYFEVVKGGQFLVETPNGKIQVLGTHFNVKSRGSILEVTCLEGRVAVSNNAGIQLKELVEKDVVKLEFGEIKDSWKTGGQTQADWISGIFKFRNTKLKNVLNELERQFDIEISSKKVSTEIEITCNFQNKNLESALKTTLSPLGIQFVIMDKHNVEIFK